MKKTLVTILSILLILSTTSAFALSWVDAETETCEEYTLTADKYERIEGDIGASYKKNPNATAKIGDTVYFDLSAVDTNGEEVEVEIEYHNLGNIEVVGNLFRAKVVGAKPYVKISIEEKTDIADLTYNGESIVVVEDTVIIGELAFLRDENGKVLDVAHEDNTAEMLKDLAALGIVIDDIYNGKICMTDDILISNFGKVCKTEATAAWYVENEVLGIPKTGDASIIFPALAVIGVVAVAVPWRKR